MFEHILSSLMGFFGTLNYSTIFVLMVMESSIIPVPSELVMIPAGIIASQGVLNPLFAIFVGGIGSVIGAMLNYWILGQLLGKPFLLKYGKYILITHKKYQRAEDLFLRNSYAYTFIGRFIPVVRHVISIPAGIFSMRTMPFIGLTFLGATLWCGFLVALGYYFGQNVINVVRQYSHEATYIIIPLIAGFLWWKIFRKK